MAQFEFKCPQCGQTVSADETFRGQTVECPFCEKGIVVPRTNGAIKKPSVTLRPVRQNVPPPPPPPPPDERPQSLVTSNNGNGHATEYEIMANREAARHLRERILTLLLFLVKMAAVLGVVVVGFEKWKDFRASAQTEKYEALEKDLLSQREKLEEQSRQMTAAAEQNAKLSEKKNEELAKMVHEYEQKSAENEKAVKDLHAQMKTLTAEHERKMAELKERYENELTRLRTAQGNRRENANRQVNAPTDAPRPMVRCSRCSGRGEIARKVTCRYCGGSGRDRVVTTRWVSGDSFRRGREKTNTTTQDCTHCLPGDFRGRGSKGYTIETKTCPVCEGKGRVPKE